MNRKGFTLIELLIVVVIIGILAAIAIPKFANTKQKPYYASMKADLRNLVTAEEAYFADSVRYNASLSSLGGACPLPAGDVVNYCPSSGNYISAITKTVDGWNASMTNQNMTAAQLCSIFIGTVAVAPASKEGEPKCQ